MQKFTKRELIIIGIFITIMLVTGAAKYCMNGSNELVFEHENEEMNEIEKNIQKTDYAAEKEKWIIVDICGEIRNPGVVKLKDGSRITDAVSLAGGLLESADRKKINMAKVMMDGEQIYIPKIGEEITLSNNPDGGLIIGNQSDKVNINTASKSELESLNGIGKVLAEKIVQHREQNGKFQDIQDIMKVSGVGEKKFESIKEHIRVN